MIRRCTLHDFDQIRLLKTYWTIPDRQIETSVVLVDANWIAE